MLRLMTFCWRGVTARWLVMSTLLAMLLTGCEQKAAVEVPPFQGVTVRLAVPQGWKLPETWEVQLQEWSAQTGATANCVELPPEKLATADADLVLLPTTEWGPSLAAARWQPWPKSALGEDQLDAGDLFRGLRTKVAESSAGLTHWPLNAPVLVVYYRADLLEQAGLKPPQTWAEYQTLLDRLADWAPGLTAVEPWGPEFRATLFLARSAAFAQHPGHYSLYFEIETGEPKIDQAGFQRGWEHARKALTKLDPACQTWQPVQCRDAVVTGHAALAIGLEPARNQQRLSLGSETPQPSDARQSPLPHVAHGSIGICRLPGSPEAFNPSTQTWEIHPGEAGPNFVTLTGFSGTCAALPKNDSPVTTEAVANLWQTLLQDSAAPLPPGLLGPTRELHTGEGGMFLGAELSPSEAGQYLAAVAKSLRDEHLILELPCVGREKFRAALTAELTTALNDPAQADGMLARTAAQWKTLLQELGVEAVRDSYRRALGLKSVAEERARALDL